MNKQTAAKLFKNQSGLARALGLSRSYISDWPDELNQRQVDEITGAAIRLRKDIQIPDVVFFYKSDLK